jgi:tripartite-type tricarboxylate transporter receptor subunit TctC
MTVTMDITLNRRALLAIAAGFALRPVPSIAQAPTDYPNRAVRLVVPFGAGSGTDFVARLLASELQRVLGAPFVVENHAGANGSIGSNVVARAAADGYTLLLGGTSTHSSAPSLFKRLPYDVERDFTPIAPIVETEFLLVVRADAPVHTVKDLAGWAGSGKARGSFAYGSATTQIAGSAFSKRMQLMATPVPYRSNPQALTDLLGKVVDFMFIDQTTALPQIRSGKLRALAVASPRRMQGLPEVPTLAEAGLADFDVLTWVGLLAPAGIPAPVADRLANAMTRIMNQAELREKLEPSGRPMSPTTRGAFVDYLRVQRQAWTTKVADAGIQPE